MTIENTATISSIKDDSLNKETAKSDGSRKVVITAGLALFAMFFGAGNLVFPMYLGANSGEYFLTNSIGFLLAGVGVPILGLVATSLYRGNYWEFFSSLGKLPAFLLVTFLIIIIGPLGAMPRIETLVYNTMSPFMPSFFSNTIFSFLFCATIFLLAYKGNKVVSILGAVLSPIKLLSFSLLIFAGFFFATYTDISSVYSFSSLKSALSEGYSTMDLLATFFFCTVVFNAIEQSMKNKQNKTSDNVCKNQLTSMIVKASLLGGTLISIVYVGFMIISYYYSPQLVGVPQEKMVQALSNAVLGNAGSLFVCLTVAFACLATGLSLAEVCSMYLRNEVFKQKVSRINCLILVMVTMYIVSNLSFSAIMSYMMPILEIVYPALIVLCIMNIIHKLTGIKFVKIPVYSVMILCFVNLLVK